MFFRTRARLVGIATLISGPMTGVCITLLRSFTSWRARWHVGFAFGMLILLFCGVYITLCILNPYLIRRFAKVELDREAEQLARQAVRQVLDHQLPDLPPHEEDLVRWEAIKKVKARLGRSSKQK